MAEPGASTADLRGMRNTLSVRVEETSLRQVAGELGMSPTGLSQFLEGGAPYRPVRRKLERWWEANGHRPMEVVPLPLARVAMDDLVVELPPAERQRAIRGMLAVLVEEHRDARVMPPAWVLEMCAEYGVAPLPPEAE